MGNTKLNDEKAVNAWKALNPDWQTTYGGMTPEGSQLNSDGTFVNGGTMGNKNNSSTAGAATGDYATLMRSMIAMQPELMAAEQKYGPQNIAQRLTNLRLALGGNESTPGPALYMEAMRKADPSGMGLLDTMTTSASNDLALGGNLNADQSQRIEQAARSGGAARGMGYGPSDIFSEMVAKLGYGDQLQQQRQAQATRVGQIRTALASRGTDVALGMGTGVGPSLISNDFAGSLLGSVYGANNQQTLARLNRPPANFGGTGVGGAFGGNSDPKVNYPNGGSSGYSGAMDQWNGGNWNYGNTPGY